MVEAPDHFLYHPQIWMGPNLFSLKSDDQGYVVIAHDEADGWANLVEVYKANGHLPMNEREVRRAMAGEFLSIPGPKERAQARIYELAEILTAASAAYYTSGQPIMEDANYDGLYTTYKALVRRYPQMKPANCPTDAVGAPVPW